MIKNLIHIRYLYFLLFLFYLRVLKFNSKMNFSILISEIAFVITGVISTIGNQLLFLQGAGGGGFSGLTVFSNNLGFYF